MIKLKLFLLIISIFSLSQGVVITGSVVDSSSGSSIPDVRIIFRLGENPDTYPESITGSGGYFRTDLSLEQNVPLQMIAEKNGYVQKRIEILINADSIDLGRIELKVLVETTVLFTGVLIDSVSEEPLSGVEVVFSTAPSLKRFLACTTEASGSFSQPVPVANNEKTLWSCAPEGYYTDAGEVTVLMDNIPQTILCNPVGSFSLQISGVVLDSVTRKPVADAMIILQTNYHDVTIDTSYTGTSGTFSRPVMIGQTSSAKPAVLYRVTAEGYNAGNGYVELPLEQVPVDLGELAILKKGPTATVFTRNHVPETTATTCRLFTLNGRMISEKKKPGTRMNVPISASQVLYIIDGSGNVSGATVMGHRITGGH